MIRLTGFLLLLLFHSSKGNFEDTRCRCICPSTEFFRAHNNTPNENIRRYYTRTNGNSLTCNTHNVVKDSVRGIVDDNRLDAFLANCNCKFESRNSVLLKDVVLLMIVLMLALAGYMTYLLALNPILRHGGGHVGNSFIPYRRQEDDMEDNIFSDSVATALSPDSNSTPQSEAAVSQSTMSLSAATTVATTTNIDMVTATSDRSGDSLQLRGLSSRTVFNKVEAEQNKWMNSVEEQRRKVLTDHTMLN